MEEQRTTPKYANIFKAAYFTYVDLWLECAPPDEKKGLKVITSVVNHKGMKKFRPSNPTLSPLQATQISLNKTKTQSFYTSVFCSDSSRQIARRNIFTYKKLSDVLYSKILTDEALMYLENWISLNDRSALQELMLVCLKGIFSVIRTYDKSMTTTNEAAFQQLWKESSVSPSRFNRRNIEVKTPLLRIRPLQIESTKTSKSSTRVSYEPTFHQERMKKLMRGTNNILKWIPGKEVSSYKDNFFPKPFGNTQSFTPLKSSTIIKLMP